ncbi:MAG TPA: hypothetical protein VHX65_05950 [Pirellulales bacterium]|nr:hypothetical protein [Pirellulales bacterium]
MGRFRVALAMVSLLIGGVAPSVTLADLAQTWVGLGANSNFSTAANWSTAVVPANNGTADLTFSGSTQLSPNVDTPWSVDSISFANSTPSFTVGGNQLTVGTGGISVGPTNLNVQTVATPIVLGASQTWTSSNESEIGGLEITNTVNLNGFNLPVGGISGGALEGNLSGNGNITITSGAFGLYGNNSYMGSTNADGGLIGITGAASLSSASTPLNFNNGVLSVNPTPSGSITIPQEARYLQAGRRSFQRRPNMTLSPSPAVSAGPEA